jgi:hypothetical protein
VRRRRLLTSRGQVEDTLGPWHRAKKNLVELKASAAAELQIVLRWKKSEAAATGEAGGNEAAGGETGENTVPDTATEPTA